MTRFFIIILLLFSANTWAHSKVLNVYNWTGYIPDKVIKQFQKQTGITVHLSEYDSNQILYAKLKANPRSGYDIIIPSNYYLQRMIAEGMVHKLDHSKLPNIKNLNPALLNPPYDPHNQYSLPYLWGSTGILVDKRYWKPSSIQSWRTLWQSRFKNQLLLTNEARDVFGIALIRLGYSINDTNPAHITKAFQMLKRLMRNVKLFNTSAAINLYTDGDITIGMAYNGDAVVAQRGNPNLTYIYPKAGFPVWVDVIAIPKSAPHVNNAYRFINFLMKPKIAKEILLVQGYSTANSAAIKLLPKKMRMNPTFNPSQTTLKRAQYQLDIGSARKIYQRYWQLLKLGDSN